MKYICIFCEKELQREFEDSKKECFQPRNGGEVRLKFDYGSRYDWMGSRDPIHEPGFNEYVHDLLNGIENDFKPTTDNGLVGSKPNEKVLSSENRANKLSACSNIMGIICDDCFEKKSHLFFGFEKQKDNSLIELVS